MIHHILSGLIQQLREQLLANNVFFSKMCSFAAIDVVTFIIS